MDAQAAVRRGSTDGHPVPLAAPSGDLVVCVHKNRLLHLSMSLNSFSGAQRTVSANVGIAPSTLRTRTRLSTAAIGLPFRPANLALMRWTRDGCTSRSKPKLLQIVRASRRPKNSELRLHTYYYTYNFTCYSSYIYYHCTDQYQCKKTACIDTIR